MSPRGTSRVDYLLHDQTRHGSRKHYLQNTIPVNEASVAPNPGICDHLAFNNATLLVEFSVCSSSQCIFHVACGFGENDTDGLFGGYLQHDGPPLAALQLLRRRDPC